MIDLVALTVTSRTEVWLFTHSQPYILRLNCCNKLAPAVGLTFLSNPIIVTKDLYTFDVSSVTPLWAPKSMQRDKNPVELERQTGILSIPDK